MVRFTLFIIILLQLGVAAAQQKPVRLLTYTVADGLPQSFVSGLVQDRAGFIWIATRDGLARFDGRGYLYFRHDRQDSTSLSGNIITDLFLDNRDQLWIMQENGTIDLLNTTTGIITRLTEKPSFRVLINTIRTKNSIQHASDGSYWIITENGDLWIVDLQAGIITPHTYSTVSENHSGQFKGIGRDGALMVLVAETGLLWLTLDLRIVRQVTYDFSHPTLHDPVLTWKVNNPLIRNNGDIIVPDDRRLIIYSQNSKRFGVVDLPPQQKYAAPILVQDSTGRVIVESDYGLYDLDTQGRLHPWDNSTTRPQRQAAASMLVDRAGILWKGTNGHGLHLYALSKTQMPHIPYDNNFPIDIITTLGVSKSQLAQTFIQDLNIYYLRTAKSNEGKIWIAKAGPDPVHNLQLAMFFEGQFDKPTWHFPRGRPNALYGIDALHVSRNQQILWAIDHSSRLIQFDVQKQTAIFHKAIVSDALQDRWLEINGLFTADDNEFWISTTEGLLCHTLSNGKTSTSFSRADNFRILCLYADPKKPTILWLGTYMDGLIRFDTKANTYRSFGPKQGLPNQTVYSILPDQQGNLWCSTNKGIFAFNTDNNNVQLYLLEGDNPNTEFNRFHYLSFPDGRLTFGGTEGYTIFDPKDIKEDDYSPELAFIGLSVNNRMPSLERFGISSIIGLNQINALSLRHNENFISVEFAALQYNSSNLLQYRYKLKGIDKDWVYAGAHNVASYTSLPPGHYTLTVNASNASGIWSTHSKNLDIIISPPFWQTWWFRIFVLLTTTGVVYYVAKRRIHSIRQKDQQRLDFERETMQLEAQALRAQMNPHFIFNCLNSIKSLIQQNEQTTAVRYLTTFSKLLRQQLNNHKQEISLQEELDTCQLYLKLEGLRFADRVSYTIQIDPTIDINSIKVPPLLIQPFLENAIIHGILPKDGPGTIHLQVVQKGDHIVCRIDDNGIGREAAEQSKLERRQTYPSKGTGLVQNRVELHNRLDRSPINIQIIDKKNELQQPSGTTVILTFNYLSR